MIGKAVAALPPPAGEERDRWRQYEEAKQQLSRLAATCGEYQRMCKAIADWLGIRLTRHHASKSSRNGIRT